MSVRHSQADWTLVKNGRRFDARLDPTRPPREMAIAWALEWRKWIEEGD